MEAKMNTTKKTSGTVKAAKKVAAEKNKGKDDGRVSKASSVVSRDIVKKNPASSGSSKRAPGGKTKGA